VIGCGSGKLKRFISVSHAVPENFKSRKPEGLPALAVELMGIEPTASRVR